MNPPKRLTPREQSYIPEQKKCCAFCACGLGLIMHREGYLRFCCEAHKKVYQAQRQSRVRLMAKAQPEKSCGEHRE